MKWKRKWGKTIDKSKISEWTIVQGFLTRELCEILESYTDLAINNNLMNYHTVNHVLGNGMCHDLYGDGFCEAIGLAKLPELERFMGGKPSLTYGLLRQYQNKASLTWHRDRWQCEFSASVQVSKTPWAIHFARNATIGGQWKKDASVILQQGDAVLYKGCEIYHSRDKLKYHRSRHLFLHYVEKGDALDTKDGRPEYGINNQTRGLQIVNSKRRTQ